MTLSQPQPPVDAPGPPHPWWLRLRLAIPLLALLIAASHGWMVDVPFQLDDYPQLFEAQSLASGRVLMGFESDIEGKLSHARLFRPLLHVVFVIDMALFGADEAWIHVSSMLWHLLASVLLFAVLRALLNRPHAPLALLAAGLYSVHPGKWASVSWVASRGDILVVVFYLLGFLALINYRRTGSRRAAILVLVTCILALLSKESAVVSPAMLAGTDFLLYRRMGWRGRLRSVFLYDAMLVGVAAVFWLSRKLVLGDAATMYMFQVRTMTSHVLMRMLLDFPEATANYLVGYFYYPDVYIRGAWALGAFIVLLGVVWWLARFRGRTAPALVLAGSYVAAAFPTMRFYHEGGEAFGVSRMFYHSGLFLTVLEALPMMALFARRLSLRVFGALYTALIVLALFTGAKQFYDRHGILIRYFDDIHAAVERAAREAGPDATIVLLDVPNRVAQMPTSVHFVEKMFKPPFYDGKIETRHVIRRNEVKLRGIYNSAAPLMVLEWQPELGRVEPLTPRVAPPRRRFTSLVLPITGDLARVEVTEQLHPRDLGALSIEFDTPPDERFGVTLRLSDESGASFDVRLDWDPALGSGSHVVIPFEQGFEWLYLGRIAAIEFVDRTGVLPIVSRLVTLATIQSIEVVSPENGAPMDFTAPRFAIRDPERSPIIKLTLLHPFAWDKLIRRSDCEVDGDRLVIPVWGPDLMGRPGNPWSSITGGGKGPVLDFFGSTTLHFAWTIEGYRGQLQHAQSRSTTFECILQK